MHVQIFVTWFPSHTDSTKMSTWFRCDMFISRDQTVGFSFCSKFNPNLLLSVNHHSHPVQYIPLTISCGQTRAPYPLNLTVHSSHCKMHLAALAPPMATRTWRMTVTAPAMVHNYFHLIYPHLWLLTVHPACGNMQSHHYSPVTTATAPTMPTTSHWQPLAWIWTTPTTSHHWPAASVDTWTTPNLIHCHINRQLWTWQAVNMTKCMYSPLLNPTSPFKLWHWRRLF